MFRKLALLGSMLITVTTLAGVSPAHAATYTDWTKVSAGLAHTCAIRGTGILYCWGSDNAGKLGNGTAGSQTRPQQIGTFTNWTSVSAGAQHTCAIRGSMGKPYCWGSDNAGKLGNGTDGSQTSPQQLGVNVSTGTSQWYSIGWTSLSAGTNHTCGLRGPSDSFCWGSDDQGKLGNGTSGSQTVPDRILDASTNRTAVSAGAGHTCAAASGNLYCWGDDLNGQVGNGTSGDQIDPQWIAANHSDWNRVRVGGQHSCAIRTVGKIYCWGANASGQALGVASGPVQVPTRIGPSSDTDWKSVDGGGFHTCGIRGDGVVNCWGSDTYGQRGNGDNASPGMAQLPGFDWTSVSAGEQHSCGIRGTGKLFCWGNAANGRLGDGASSGSVQAPQQVL